MNILVACEESQSVTNELRKLGHNAFSCDLLPCSGGNPQYHFQDDALEVLDGWFDQNELCINNNFSMQFDYQNNKEKYILKNNRIKKIGWKWDMLIAFPPCTHLSVSGARHLKKNEMMEGKKRLLNFL